MPVRLDGLPGRCPHVRPEFQQGFGKPLRGIAGDQVAGLGDTGELHVRAVRLQVCGVFVGNRPAVPGTDQQDWQADRRDG